MPPFCYNCGSQLRQLPDNSHGQNPRTIASRYCDRSLGGAVVGLRGEGASGAAVEDLAVAIAEEIGGAAMILTEQQGKDLLTVALPLMAWLKSNGHPHIQAVVTSETVEILEGLMMQRRKPFDDAEALPSWEPHLM